MTRQTTVRYSHLRLRGLFTIESDEELEAGDVCLVQSARGQELGTVLARPVGDRGSSASVGCNTGACGSCASSQGTILRRASEEDRQYQAAMDREGTRREVLLAREKVRELKLDMRIADAEYLFQKEKLIVQFTSETRVDFRDLVKDLGKELKTRIELKQIGARDEARLVGDMASCGRELCCRTFLHDLQPVSMRMAKQQKKTLDPTKISGQCGKLKCCLRYEDEVYVEMQKTLPRKNSWVRISQGIGKVLSIDLLLQKLVVDVAGERELAHVSELLETGLKPPKPGEARAQATAGPAAPRKVTPLRLPSTGSAAAPAASATSSVSASEPSSEPSTAPAAKAVEPIPAREPERKRAERPERPRGERARPDRPERPRGEGSKSRGKSRGSRSERGRSGSPAAKDPKGRKEPSSGPAKSRSRRSRSGGEGRTSGGSPPPPGPSSGASGGSTEDARRRRRRRGRRGE